MEVVVTEHRKPLIEMFRISGLHGYKDIELDFQGPARIAIAENGSGKTTFLSAMNAFVNADFEKLRSLSFRSIECKLAGTAASLVLSRSQLPELKDRTVIKAIEELVRYSSYNAAELRRLILDLDVSQLPEQLRQSAPVDEIYQRSPWGMPDVLERVRRIRSSLDQTRSEELDSLSAAIKAALKDYSVLYLPTYRRVELPLSKPPQRKYRGAYSYNMHLELAEYFEPARANPDTLGIQYGLADVQERLGELLSTIQRLSTQGYRSASANIIDDLLFMAGELKGPNTEQLPPQETLTLFLSRIEEAPDSRRERLGAIGERLSAIKELYESGALGSSQYNLLRYFLGKLSRAVDKTRELEASIEQFVARSNVYLQSSSDEKRLEYDAGSMRVFVRNLWTGGEVKLDDLSSGEKQVVSLLAHCYLNPKPKILLIDEPELSLSIEWQRRLLPDVLGSPTCAQLLAITHSPFIFDNDLDPYAGPLVITRAKPER